MKRLNRLWLATILVVFTLSSFQSARPGVFAGIANAQDLESKKIVPFVPTPQEVVDKMIELAGVKQGDVVYDLYAFSRPNHLLAHLGYPLTRMLQKQFAEDSKQAMFRAVRDNRLN